MNPDWLNNYPAVTAPSFNTNPRVKGCWCVSFRLHYIWTNLKNYF